jgi:hypothetical protein
MQQNSTKNLTRFKREFEDAERIIERDIQSDYVRDRAQDDVLDHKPLICFQSQTN